MNTIFGRIAIILLTSTFAIFLGINIYTYFFNTPIDGYYTYTGLNSVIDMFDNYTNAVNNAWYTFEGFIKTASDIYNFDKGAFVLSCFTWFVPYAIMCLFGNLATFLIMIFKLLGGGYSYYLPHIY